MTTARHTVVMPELPEVERVRRSLVAHVVGQRIVHVDLRRRDVVDFGTATPRSATAMRTALLEGRVITAVNRRGKQLGVVSDHEASPALCIHLGMTGTLTCRREREAPAHAKHTHVVWHLASGHVVTFHDPRRFGGVWCFPTWNTLETRRWSVLGEDAMTIEPDDLHQRLHSTTRGLKAALLDQSIVAGLGNIYVDELLFARGLHPLDRASALDVAAVDQLVHAMRDLLERALASGGSTLRNYVDADGHAGGFQFEHRVYGRGGQACERCKTILVSRTIAGRTTVYCPTCQRRRTRRRVSRCVEHGATRP